MAIKQRSKSLKSRSSSLADTFHQLEVLNAHEVIDAGMIPFREKVGHDIIPGKVEVFQINIGKLCNQTCAHCHVDAGPDRREENMDFDTLKTCLDIIREHKIPTVDITGGAPEMNPHFRWFVESCSAMDVEVMVRCNLTIIMANGKYRDLPEFYAQHNVHVISSLPYFSKSRTDSQRGDGVFNDSIKALKALNEVGYGMEGSDLKLDLVYNPSGAFLPGDQHSLEREFKSQLKRKFDIEFHNLFAITNLPISRFLDYLIESDNYEDYMIQLVEAYNPATVEGLMCTYTLSVSWDGYIYDCDFNQMLDLKIDTPVTHINDFDMKKIMDRKVKVNQHCYGCTAGAGSSCGGEVV
jgi:radical SAM/Cys-rich protein